MVTTRRWTLWTALLCFMLVSLHASAYNRLSIPDVLMEKGGSIDLPVNLENEDQVVALQFVLTVPDGFTLDVNSARLTERSADHMMRVKNMQGNDYLCMVYSVNNTELSGNRGAVMYVTLHAPASVNEGDEFPMTMTDAVASDNAMNNVLDASSAGTITIARYPDLVPANITTDKSQYAPNDHIVISWTVQNTGQLSTGGGWSEQISLVDESGTLCMLGTTYYSDILGPGGTVSRQADIDIPQVPGIHGNVKPQVRIIPNSDCGERPEALGNNTIQGRAVQLDAVLYLNLSKYQVEETTTRPLTTMVTRSGNREESLTVSLTSNDSRVSLPATVTIPEGQSSVNVSVALLDNDVVDDSDKATITANASGYPRVDAVLTIEDNEFPQLTATSSVRELTEGDSFTFTVTTSKVPVNDLTVNVTCSLPGRFEYPATITIKAGETSTVAEVITVEDNVPDVDQEVTFSFTADRYEPDELWITLHDNDVPDLEMTLTPTLVGEGAGANAVLATLRRLNHTESEITLMLSDDSNGLISIGRQQVVMPAGVSELQFSIGVNDNDLAEGDRIVNVTAAIYIKSCSCQAQDEQAGHVTSQLTITDNDGPAITIASSRSMVAEGTETVLTITRNANLDQDLTVDITSDNDTGLSYEHQVTVPAGKRSVSISLVVESNTQTNDDRYVTLQAKANGFSTGSCWLMITNQSLPDAQIAELTLSKQSVEVGEEVKVAITVTNTGVLTLPAQVRTTVYLDNTAMDRLYTTNSLEPGETDTLVTTFVAPDWLGNRRVYAVVNEDKRVHELITGNNTSQNVDLAIVAPFTTTLAVDKPTYRPSETITFTGTVTGDNVAGRQVEIYLINNGCRQRLTATADQSGHFTAEYQPYGAQMGHFIAGACYPGENLTTEMASFDIYGISARSKDNGKAYSTCELGLNETFAGTIVISNPCQLPQSELTLIQSVQSANCEINFQIPTTINAGESVEVNFTIKGNDVSTGRDWQQMPVEFTTAEGARQSYTVYYYVYPQKAKLEASTSHITTTMTHGTSRDYPVTVRNVGKSETGRITLALPDFVQTLTPQEMASLQQGDTAVIVLRFLTTDEMKLNVPVTGHLAINCENGSGTIISFHVTPVSDVNGTLRVDVVDEFTFFTDEAPHVSNANVQIKKPYTSEVVAQGLTDSNGIFNAVIPEGWYTMTVTADKHNGYSNTVIVDPGVVKDEEVFLCYQTVTYSWDVVETTVDDEYVIETIATFETEVPKPVVVISLPDQQPEPYQIFPVEVSNKGLISAVDVNLSLSINNNYQFDYLNAPHLDVLEAHQNHTFYVRMLPGNSDEDQHTMRAPENDDDTNPNCFTIIARAKYKELCDKYVTEELAENIKRWGSRQCYNLPGGSGSGSGSSGPGGYSGPDYGGSGPGRPSAYDNGDDDESDIYLIHDIDDPEKFCDPKVEEVPYTNDCDESPTLVYRLKTNDGKRNERIGVAADGISELLITLDPAKSKIPSPDCGWECWWSLNGEDGVDLGYLENVNSWNDVVYHAPDDLPGELSTYDVVATLTYSNPSKHITGNYNVIIKLTRVPLLLVHGLNSTGNGCWKKLPKALVESKMYDKYQILKVDYEQTNKAHFKENVNVVGDNIEKIFKIYRAYGIQAAKVDIIGHSMGGILARLHVQEVDRSSARVHKIITLNTPHSGSEWADFLQDPVFHEMINGFVQGDGSDNIIFGDWSKFLLKLASLCGIVDEEPPAGTDIPSFIIDKLLNDNAAIIDLAVESDATDNYLNDATKLGYMKDIPVHAVCTIYDGADFNYELTEDLREAFPFVGVDYKTMSLKFNLLSVMVKELLKFYGYQGVDYFVRDLFNNDENDWVVAVGSQIGGLVSDDLQSKIIAGPNHMRSTDNWYVIEHVKGLLSASVDDEAFSKYGYSPEDRNYTPWSPLWAPRVQRAPRNRDGETGEIHISVENLTDSLAVRVEGAEQFDHHIVLLNFNGANGTVLDSVDFRCVIPSVFSGDIKVYAYCYNDDDKVLVSDSVVAHVEAPRAVPVGIEALDNHYLDLGGTAKAIINCVWDDGTETLVYPDYVMTSNGIVGFDGHLLTALKQGTDSVTYHYQGMTCKGYVRVFGNNEEFDLNNDSQSICSSVTLSFKQKAVLTRQAFRGTLTVSNGHENAALENLKLNLEVRDLDGHLATSHEFQINPESLEGFTGELDFGAGWRLESRQTGVATILFIPTKYAAPTEPKVYAFGGSFSYTDPSTGLTVTRELTPVELTVNPSPNLVLDYFLQRDIMGDDPLTEVVEPSQDAEFALLIDNQGYGDAINFKMITHQPEIIENEKGLLINFEFVSSQLNGDEAILAMGEDIPTDFGRINAHSQAYAQWWLRSTLLGHFISYDVSYNHVTSYGNEDLSLLDTVRVHELIHGFTTDDVTGNRMRGFLSNDLPDADDKPDIIHFTNATEEGVAMSTATLNRISDTEYLLEVNTGGPGWNYGSVIDPTVGRQKVVSVVRQSDGKTIYADNVWTTDRTLIDGADWLYENRLHYVVEIMGMTDSYLISFEPKPETELEVISFDGLPAEGVDITEPVTHVTVNFNKPVDASTFSTDDITLTCDGKPLDASLIGITQLSETSFDLDVSQLTYTNGFYVLTVQAVGIKDTEGFYGSKGKHVTWTQYMGGVAHLEVSVEPAGAGLAVPGSGDYPVNSTIHMRAMAEPGYTFMSWMSGEETISNEPEFDYLHLGDAHLTAVFYRTTCSVEIIFNAEQGTITGGNSQICDYGTVLELKAEPAEGYEFYYWLVNGQFYSDNPELTITVEGNMTIEAVFKEIGAPDITLPPVLNYDDETLTLTVEGNGEIHVYVDGVEVTVPYTFEQTDEEVTYTVTATAQEPGKEISETVTITVTVPAKTVTPEVTDAPVISLVEVTQEYVVIHIEGNGTLSVWVNGEEVILDENGNYVLLADEEDDMIYIVTATAQEPGKLVSEPTEFTITVPAYNDNTNVINEVNAGKSVIRVRYFNLAGQETQQVDGVTLIVTTYSDGTTSTVKVMK